MSKTAIVLLNYNSSDETIECIKSLDSTLKNSESEIILVDNNSRQTEFTKLDKFLSSLNSSENNIHLIKHKINSGFSGGNNVGIEYALKNNFEYVLILNNDTIVSDDFLDVLIKEIEDDKNNGIVVPKIYFAKGHEFHKDKYKKEDLGKVIWYAGGKIDWDTVNGIHVGVDEVDNNSKYNSVVETDYATGACMLVKAELLKKIGLFDVKYFLYFEDSDLSMRFKNSGYKIKVVPTAIIWHKNAGSTGGSGSDLQDYYISRNRMMFGMKYAPYRTKLALIRESLKILRKGRKWQKQGVKDYFLRRFGKGTYPVSI